MGAGRQVTDAQMKEVRRNLNRGGSLLRAAKLSITAGFDGVELHAATGYLPNQFQVTGSNRRTDAYGGSLEGRTRFTLEVIEALCGVRGADRVGIKIAPGFTVNDTFDADPGETYTYLA